MGLTLGLILGLTVGVSEAKPKPKASAPRRTAWVGLDRGPLAPAQALALEEILIDELGGYKGFYLVDAAGHPLNERALAKDAARMGKLLDQGVQAFLDLANDRAIDRLDQAIALFESRLTGLRDHSLLHEALLAKAETLNQAKKPETARIVLAQLAALEPKKPPSKKTHRPAFVELWDRARSEIGERGTVEISTDVEGASIRVDGKELGKAPVLSPPLLPGRHYVVAHWPSFSVSETVVVSSSARGKAVIRREGPADSLRTKLLETVAFRRGEDKLKSPVRSVAKLAEADDVLVGALRRDGSKKQLTIAHYDRHGARQSIVRVELPSNPSEQTVAVRRAAAAMFIGDQSGELEVGSDGTAKPAPGLADEVFGKGKRSEAEPEPPAAGPENATELAEITPAIVQPDRPSLRWWLIGAGATAAAVAGALLIVFLPAPSDATSFTVIFPE